MIHLYHHRFILRRCPLISSHRNRHPPIPQGIKLFSLFYVYEYRLGSSFERTTGFYFIPFLSNNVVQHKLSIYDKVNFPETSEPNICGNGTTGARNKRFLFLTRVGPLPLSSVPQPSSNCRFLSPNYDRTSTALFSVFK